MAFNNDAFLKRNIDPNLMAQLQKQMMAQADQPDTSEFDGEPTQADMNELSAQNPEVSQGEVNQAATGETVPQPQNPQVPAENVARAPAQESVPKTAKELLQERLDQDRQLRQASLEAAQKALEAQAGGIRENEAYLKNLKEQGLGLDLSPFLAYVDSQTGSNLFKGYRPPQTADERRKEINDLQKALQAERKDYSKEVVGLVSAQQQKKGQDSQDRIASDKMFKAFIDPIKDADKEGTTFASLESAFKPDANGMIPSDRFSTKIIEYVRAVGQEKGPLSDNDVARASIPTINKLLADIQTRFGSGGKIPWNDPSIKAIIENTLAAKKYSYDKYRNKLNTSKDYFDRLPGYTSYADSIEGLHQDGLSSLDRAFSSRDYFQQTSEKLKNTYGPKKSNKKGSSNFSEEKQKRLEELKSKLGK